MLPQVSKPLQTMYLSHFLRRSILFFFDDILVYSNTWLEHLYHLREVFQVSRNHQLFSKQSKCSFGMSQIEYLRHVISQWLVAMNKTKVDCIA